MSRSCRPSWPTCATLLEAAPLAADASGYRSVRLVSPNRIGAPASVGCTDLRTLLRAFD